MMKIRAIRNEADYDWALAEIERYFRNEPKPGTTEAERFDVLAALIEAYEARHWPVEPADPIEAIKYRMELSKYTPADLGRLLGSRSRASEILNRRRPLTIAMAHKLSKGWNIPADTLLKPYRLRRSKKEPTTKRGTSAGVR
jgi:HTH-type transcriptional regulator / antitoxin HigA